MLEIILKDFTDAFHQQFLMLMLKKKQQKRTNKQTKTMLVV